MKNRWQDDEAAQWGDDLLGQRVYTSRLLGEEPDLVLHGGGNTSVKVHEKNFFGDEEEILYVKGSGGDLRTIGKDGFAPVRMETLLRLAEQESVSDSDMVVQMRAAMTDPGAPNPSIEAILHAVLPFVFVDHTHADAILALTNNEFGDDRVRDLFGNRVLVVPYVMPGFVLARKVFEMIRERELIGIEGILLMHHGLFTFSDDAKSSYDRMIALVTEAGEYLERETEGHASARAEPGEEDLVVLAEVRRKVSRLRGRAVVARLDRSPEACGFSNLEEVDMIGTRGPLTPNHVLRTKRYPLVLRGDYMEMADVFAANYTNYFQRYSSPKEVMLDPAPRWAIWPGQGIVSFGANVRDASITGEIAAHTWRVIQTAEKLGGWWALPEAEIYAIEYWELEQAKLRKAKPHGPLQGKVALVTGAAAGIGKACLDALRAEGAAVTGLDINPEVEVLAEGADTLGIACDVTDDAAVKAAVEETVRRFGGLDILVSNAGIFTAGAYIEEMIPENWEKSVAVNLTSHQRLLQFAIPYLKQGIDATAIFIGSRNVQAPGAGAASYSVTKAGLTQLVRVAALELAKDNVRVNIIHPDAVFDTKLWTPEALQRSAERYGLTVEEYKTRNLLKAEITSADVGCMVCAMAGPAFGKTTGAQIPLDGGNDRVI